jgi:hypothetical protein
MYQKHTNSQICQQAKVTECPNCHKLFIVLKWKNKNTCSHLIPDFEQLVASDTIFYGLGSNELMLIMSQNIIYEVKLTFIFL